MSFFKNYIAYLKDNPKGYWFRRKGYGWGWVPAQKEGWLVILLYVAAVGRIAASADAVRSASDVLLRITTPIVVLTIFLIIICYKTGEKPRWQWGTEH